jgi:hypothetical protein
MDIAPASTGRERFCDEPRGLLDETFLARIASGVTICKQKTDAVCGTASVKNTFQRESV